MGIIKLILQTMVFSIVFTMFATHRAWGERDRYKEKLALLFNCRQTLARGTAYEEPKQTYRATVKHRKIDMVCICSIITAEDEQKISVEKLLRLARECGKPLPAGSSCGSKCLMICVS
jgi:hypothetical protein